MTLRINEIDTCAELAEYIEEVGLLPLLPLSLVSIPGWSADEAVTPACRYTRLSGGGWQWKLWDWKGQLIQETGCAYGRFITGRAAFVSREWWSHLCNWRRARVPAPQEGSAEESILFLLREHAPVVNRDLRRLCGFTDTRARHKFDTYLTRLQMGTFVVTEDFEYPRDKHGREYGWGWSRYTTPEERFGPQNFRADCSSEASHDWLTEHLAHLLPNATVKQLEVLLG